MSQSEYLVSDLITHRAPMILLDEIDHFADDTLQVSVTITDESPFLYDGAVPAYVGVEYMAQAVACFSGINALNADQPIRHGYLIGTRRLRLSQHKFVIGDRLTIHVAVIYNFGDMSSFDCKISRGETVLANAKLNVYQPLEFEGTNLSGLD